MARRATLFKQLKAEARSRSVLFLAGPYEYMQPQATALDKLAAKALTEGFSRLGYDLGALAPEEAAMLSAHGLTPPSAWKPLEADIQVAFLPSPAGKIAVLLLPQTDPSAPVSIDMIAAVLDRARKVRLEASLVAVISPWGLAGENALLSQADGAIQLLLGAGPGPGLKGRIMDNGRAAWVRAFDKGKSVCEIDLLALPGPGKSAQWKEDVTIRFDSIVLDESVEPAKDVESLFEWLEQPK